MRYYRLNYRLIWNAARAVFAGLAMLGRYFIDRISRCAIYVANAVAPASALDWRFGRHDGPVKFLTPRILKPEYRESYASHGLSLRDLRGYC